MKKVEIKNKDQVKKDNKDLILTYNQKSRFAEAIKTIRTNLAFSNIDKKNKVILITSPEPGDGKSFISSNLAIAYSQEGNRVLIIDCDLRRGRQHNIFGLMNPTNGGYSNFILNYEDIRGTKNEELEEDEEAQKKKDKETAKTFNSYIYRTSVKDVSLIPSGPVPPNPVELLSSTSNEKLINDLRKVFDIIILDCPPIIGLSDTMLLTKYSDSNLLVISSKKTTNESLGRAQKIFQQVNAPITGVIFNKVNVKGSGYYYSSYYTNDYYGDPD